MYRCVGCEGVLEDVNGRCECGKTFTNHKGKIDGENFVKIPGQTVCGRTKVRTCPLCGWTGLVIPRIGTGCPIHGIWYKDVKEKPKIQEPQEEEEIKDDTKPKRSERRDYRRRGSPHGKKSRYG